MKKIISSILATVTLSLGSAHAVTVHLNSLSLDADGVTRISNILTPTGVVDFLISGAVASNQNEGWDLITGLRSGSGGLYLDLDGDHPYYHGWRKNDSHQIDGKHITEGVLIQAKEAGTNNNINVEFTSFTFSYVGSNDDFSIFAGDSFWNDLDLEIENQDIPGNYIPVDVELEDVSTIVVAALQHDDDWKLKTFTFNVPGPSVEQPVPVPGAFALFAAGLGGLAAARRQR